MFHSAFLENTGALNHLELEYHDNYFYLTFNFTKNDNKELSVEVRIIYFKTTMSTNNDGINHTLKIIKIIKDNFAENSIKCLFIDSGLPASFINNKVYTELAELYSLHKDSLEKFIFYDTVVEDNESFVEFFVKNVEIGEALRMYGSKVESVEQCNAMINLVSSYKNIIQILLHVSTKNDEFLNNIANTQSEMIANGNPVIINQGHTNYIIPFEPSSNFGTNNLEAEILIKNLSCNQTKSSRNRLKL